MEEKSRSISEVFSADRMIETLPLQRFTFSFFLKLISAKIYNAGNKIFPSNLTVGDGAITVFSPPPLYFYFCFFVFWLRLKG